MEAQVPAQAPALSVDLATEGMAATAGMEAPAPAQAPALSVDLATEGAVAMEATQAHQSLALLAPPVPTATSSPRPPSEAQPASLLLPTPLAREAT